MQVLGGRRIFKLLLQKFWILVLAASLGFLFSLFLTEDMPVITTYSATVSIYSTAPQSLYEGAVGRREMRAHLQLISSERVASKALISLRQYNLTTRDIMAMTAGDMKPTSTLIKIGVLAPEGQMAVDVANAVSKAFIEEMSGTARITSVKVLDAARTATQSSIGELAIIRTRLVISLVAVMIAVFIIFLPEISNGKISGMSDLEDLDVAMLAAVPFDEI